MDTAAMVNFIQILIILGWTTFCADGTVTLSVINSVDGGNKLECDTEVVLVCKIDPYSNLISWSINGTLYARCSPICLDNPPYPGNYSFTYDVANGEFNLTINQVTVGDSNTNFQCDDGSNVDSITTEVVPAYSGFVTKVVETDGYQLVFTTACVHPDVQFNWFTVKVGSTNRKIYKTNQNKSEEVTLCELDNKCGGMGTARVSSSVTVGNALSGEERFLEVDVTYKNPNENRTFRFSDRTFKFKEHNYSTITNHPTVPHSNSSHGNTIPPTESSPVTQTIPGNTTESTEIRDRPNDGLIIVSSAISASLALPVIVSVSFVIYKILRRKRTEGTDKMETNTFTNIFENTQN